MFKYDYALMIHSSNFARGMVGNVNVTSLIFFYLQVTIPCIWIFAVILTMRGFILQGFGKELAVRSCDHYWTNEKLKLAYQSFSLTFVVIFLLLIVGLYSNVVYTLWFKPRGDNEVTNQQV